MKKYLTNTLLSAALLTGAVARADTNTWDGVYSEPQATRGEAAYMAQCAQCHGPQLDGIDSAPALTGGAFASNWSGVTLDAMLERIRISMPQNAPGSLSRKETADVMAFLMQANGFPSGESDLPRQAGFLRTIVYEANRP